LSGWYLTGAEGVLPKSIPDAFLWARKSADKGSARGHYAVGYFYEKGLGVRQNKKEANRWYRRSASMGDKKAIARLDELSRGKLFRKSSVFSNLKFFS
jgi:TPR repeat protein